MRVDGSIKSLIQGVSQQPPRSRLPGQCTLQENASSNPVDGLTRRPPMEWISNLFSTSAAVQFYDLKLGSQSFIVASTPGSIRVFTLDGTEKTVTETGDAFDYLTGGKLVFANLENDTYVSNTAITCAMETEFPTFIDYGPIVYIRGGNYGATYTITVRWKDAGPGGTNRSCTVTHTTSTTDVTTIQTKAIAQGLEGQLLAATTNSFNSLFDIGRVEDVLYIQWKPGTGRTDHFTAVASDTAGNNNCIACSNDIKTVAQLPRFAPHGYFVRVSGDGSADEDDYYLEFSVTPDDQGITPPIGQGFGSAGIWIETVKNKIPYLINWETMPHVLRYNENTDTFTFAQGQWADRAVGDTESNPDPSFIGRSIDWIGYFQGRLTFLAGPAAIMSRTNKPLDFWSASATSVADSDPIDVQSTAKGVTKMLYGVPINRDLVIFADNAQFVILGRNTITPDNCSLILTTSFEINLDLPPVPAGRNIFYGFNYGAYLGIGEFFTSDSADVNDSRAITEHVLKYIPEGARRLASSSNFDTLLVQTANRKDLYVYEYIWVGDRKAQSSWSRWMFPSDIYHFFFSESVVYVISRSGNNYFLEKFDLNTQFDEDLNYQVKLDRKRLITGVTTTVTNPLPYVTDIDDMVFVQGTGCPYPGMRAMVSSYNAGTGVVTFTTNMGGGTIIAGIRYRTAYRPSMPFVRDRDGVKIGTGRLIIGKFIINCKETGSMEASILSKYRETRDIHFSGRVVGSPNSVVGVPAITDAAFVIPYRDNTDHGELELWTDSHEPLTIMDIEWVGQYTKRGQRVTQGE